MFVGKGIQDINKELNLIKLKTVQLVEKQQTYQNMTLAYEKLNRHVKSLNRGYLATSKELNKLSHTIEHMKYVPYCVYLAISQTYFQTLV